MGSQWGAYTYIRKYGSTNITRASRSNESTLSRRLAAAHVNCSILSPINSTAWRVSRSNEEKTTAQAVIFGHLPSLQSNFQPQNAFLSPFFLFLPRIDLLEKFSSKSFQNFSFLFLFLFSSPRWKISFSQIPQTPQRSRSRPKFHEIEIKGHTILRFEASSMISILRPPGISISSCHRNDGSPLRRLISRDCIRATESRLTCVNIRVSQVEKRENIFPFPYCCWVKYIFWMYVYRKESH